MTITGAVQRLAEWFAPRQADHRGKPGPYRLKCSFEEAQETEAMLNSLPLSLPLELAEFWKNTTSARLFEDVDYGQWGLEILSPDQAESFAQMEARKRPGDYLPGDFVVGRLLGDSDFFLVLRCFKADVRPLSLKETLSLK